MKGPSYFAKGQSPEYQIALIKMVYKAKMKHKKNEERRGAKLMTLKEYLGFIPYNGISNKTIYEYALKINKSYIVKKNNKTYYPKHFLDLCIKNEIIDFPISYKIEIYNYKKC